MPKYNFHDIKDQVKKGDALPADINKPVKEYLNKIGRPDAAKALERKENLVQCGRLIIFNADNPLKRIELRTNYGMVEGWDLIAESIGEDGKCIIDETHIRNANLNMAKRENKK